MDATLTVVTMLLVFQGVRPMDKVAPAPHRFNEICNAVEKNQGRSWEWMYVYASNGPSKWNYDKHLVPLAGYCGHDNIRDLFPEECKMVDFAVQIHKSRYEPLDAPEQFLEIHGLVKNSPPELHVDKKWLQDRTIALVAKTNSDLKKLHEYCTVDRGIYVIECAIITRAITMIRRQSPLEHFAAPEAFRHVHDLVESSSLKLHADLKWLETSANHVAISVNNDLHELHMYCTGGGDRIYIIECDIINRAMATTEKNSPSKSSTLPEVFKMIQDWVKGSDSKLHTKKKWVENRARKLAEDSAFSVPDLHDYCEKQDEQTYKVECDIIKKAREIIRKEF